MGIAGTNGPREFQGGWPLFNIPGFTDIGSTELFMPYTRKDDTITYVANFTWTEGSHEVRWGLDFINMKMNHIQPEFAGGFGGARGRFQFSTGVTQLCLHPDGRGGCRRLSPSTDQVNGMASFLLGLPQRVGKNLLVVAPFTTRNWGYSLYLRDRWQLTPKFTFSYGLRWEYHPIPTRADRGLERFDADLNKMLIGGVGTVPEALGVHVDRDLFGPRLGIAYRATDTLVVRAGYGITIDPFPLARPLRTNFPVLVEQIFEGPNSFTPFNSLEQGIPPLVEPHVGNGIIDVPGTATTFGIPAPKFERGYVQSWNLTLQKELRWGFVGEVGYVATPQVRQMGFRELHYADIGTGSAGRQLFKRFGRTGNTRLATPLGGTHYDSLQARLQRRFSSGYSVDVAYTWGKSITNSGENNSDRTLDSNIPEFLHLNRRVSGFDRRHNLQISHITELPFGRGRRWLSDTHPVLAALVSGWQVNGILSFMSGTPFSVTASGTSLNAPGNSQRADLVKEPRIVGGIGPDAPYFDPTAFRPVEEPRFGTAGFNLLTGPAVRSWDFGLFRNFRIHEEVQLQFRMEAFNFTNTPQFDNPSGNRVNVSRVRFNPDGTIQDRRGFGSITSARGERAFRFGLRLSF